MFNRYARYLEAPEIERIIVGEKMDCVDKLRVRKYGDIVYLYSPGEEK